MWWILSTTTNATVTLSFFGYCYPYQNHQFHALCSAHLSTFLADTMTFNANGGTLNMVIYGICLNLKWFASANTFFRATAAAAYHAGSRRMCLLTLLRLLLGCLPTTTFLDENSVELFCWPMMNIPVSEMKINIFILHVKVTLTVALFISLREF